MELKSSIVILLLIATTFGRLDAGCIECSLSSVGTFPAGNFPLSIAYSPDGKCLAVVDNASSSVNIFRVNADCSLSDDVPGSPFATGNFPELIAYSPNGKCLAVVNGGDTVSIFRVNADCSLSDDVPGSPFAVGNFPQSLAYSPNGQCLAVTDTDNSDVIIFRVNADCSLSDDVPGSPFATGNFPLSVAYSPDGKCLAVSNIGSNTIRVFRTDFLSQPIVNSIAVECGEENCLKIAGRVDGCVGSPITITVTDENDIVLGSTFVDSQGNFMLSGICGLTLNAQHILTITATNISGNSTSTQIDACII